jgi:hypothetical protein
VIVKKILFSPLLSKNSMQKKDLPTSLAVVLSVEQLESVTMVTKEKCTLLLVLLAELRLKFHLSQAVTGLFIVENALQNKEIAIKTSTKKLLHNMKKLF